MAINAFFGANADPIPSLDEMADGVELFVFAIERAEFEQVWAEAWRRLVTEAEDVPTQLARQES